jgi:hypothetical protein
LRLRWPCMVMLASEQSEQNKRDLVAHHAGWLQVAFFFFDCARTFFFLPLTSLQSPSTFLIAKVKVRSSSIDHDARFTSPKIACMVRIHHFTFGNSCLRNAHPSWNPGGCH